MSTAKVPSTGEINSRIVAKLAELNGQQAPAVADDAALLEQTVARVTASLDGEFEAPVIQAACDAVKFEEIREELGSSEGGQLFTHQIVVAAADKVLESFEEVKAGLNNHVSANTIQASAELQDFASRVQSALLDLGVDEQRVVAAIKAEPLVIEEAFNISQQSEESFDTGLVTCVTSILAAAGVEIEDDIDGNHIGDDCSLDEISNGINAYINASQGDQEAINSLLATLNAGSNIAIASIVSND